MIYPETIIRDERGEFYHSVTLTAEDETPFVKLPGAENMEFYFISFYDDAPQELLDIYNSAGVWNSAHEWSDAVGKWEPTKPEGEGWFLMAISDSEDGHFACFTRPILSISN